MLEAGIRNRPYIASFSKKPRLENLFPRRYVFCYTLKTMDRIPPSREEIPIEADGIDASVLRELFDGSATISSVDGKLRAKVNATEIHELRTVAGRDYFILALGALGQRLIRVEEIHSLEDIPFGLIRKEEIPPDMYARLKANTSLEEVIRKYQNHRTELIQKLGEQNVSNWVKIQELKDSLKRQKRRIKALLQEMGVVIKPGSELSRLLRLDNFES